MGQRGKQVLSPVLLYFFYSLFLVQNFLFFSLHRNFNLFMATEVLFSKCLLNYDKSVLPLVSPPQGYSSKEQLLPWRHFWPMCTHGQGGRIPPPEGCPLFDNIQTLIYCTVSPLAPPKKTSLHKCAHQHDKIFSLPPLIAKSDAHVLLPSQTVS